MRRCQKASTRDFRMLLARLESFSSSLVLYVMIRMTTVMARKTLTYVNGDDTDDGESCAFRTKFLPAW